MGRVLDATKRFWGSSGPSARMVWLIALASGTYFTLFAGFAVVAGLVSTGGPFASMPLLKIPAAIVQFVMVVASTVGPIVVIQALIGLALRASTPTFKWIGSSVAALISIPGLVVVISVMYGVTSGATFERPTSFGAGMEWFLWGPIVIVSALYAVVALLGLREATKSGRHRRPAAA